MNIPKLRYLLTAETVSKRVTIEIGQRVGWQSRNDCPPAKLRVTTPLANTERFHLLTSFKTGLDGSDSGANQSESEPYGIVHAMRLSRPVNHYLWQR